MNYLTTHMWRLKSRILQIEILCPSTFKHVLHDLCPTSKLGIFQNFALLRESKYSIVDIISGSYLVV